MIRFFSESRRMSRRFVPGRLPIGVSVERLEVRCVLSGFDDSTPAVQTLMDLIDADLNASVGSGDETVYLDAWDISGSDPTVILTDIGNAQMDINNRLNAKITAWTNYKTLLESDIIRINNHASTAGWASDWRTTQTPTNAQTELRNRLADLNAKLPECDAQVTRITNLMAWDDLVFGFIASTIEHEQVQGVDGGGNPIIFHSLHSMSFAEAEAEMM